MLAKELISDIVPPVKTSNSGHEALNIMEDFRVNHLPIVNNRDFLGLISDEDIFSMDDQNEALGSSALSLFSPYVFEHQHIYEVIELVSKLKLSLVPVLNERKEYLGSIVIQDIIEKSALLTGAEQPGAILVLNMTSRDYYLSEIARLVEENDARIISLYVSSSTDSTEIDVTLKLNLFDLTPIIRSFERFGYSIKASFRDEDKLDTLYRDRYEEFMRYLNI